MKNAKMSETETETARITALRRYDILDTPPDSTFNRMTSLAAKVFSVPVAMISLVAEDRIWLKSRHGLDIEQLDREAGLCAAAVLADELYVVEDARQDPRSKNCPLVIGQFGLGFYAGAPLTTHDGHKLGTFCIIDNKPRHLTPEQREILQEMAGIVMDEIEMRLAVRTAIGENARHIAEMRRHTHALSD